MAFALSWEANELRAGGFLYFDAVLGWNRSFTGTVTKHPVDQGGSITDHYINNNPTFTISIVISGSDISLASAALRDEDDNQPFNTRASPSATQIKSSDSSVLTRFIPNAIGQFLPDSIPEIEMDDFRTNSVEEVQDILIGLQSGEGYNDKTFQFETILQPVTLYETDEILTLVRKLPTSSNSFLVITSINFREDVESGYAIYADITMERVRFANLKKATIPQEVVFAMKSKITSEKSKGRVDSTEVGAEELPKQEDRDGLRTPYGDTVEKQQKQFQLGQPLII